MVRTQIISSALLVVSAVFSFSQQAGGPWCAENSSYPQSDVSLSRVPREVNRLFSDGADLVFVCARSASELYTRGLFRAKWERRFIVEIVFPRGIQVQNPITARYYSEVNPPIGQWQIDPDVRETWFRVPYTTTLALVTSVAGMLLGTPRGGTVYSVGIAR